MPTPTEHKTVQSRILQYAKEIGWTYIDRAEAERRRGFNDDSDNIQERCRTASLYFEDLLYQKVKEFNPKYSETQSSLIKTFTALKPDIYGNREFLKYLRNEGTYYCKEQNRDLNLILIDYENPENNVFEVTEEFYWFKEKIKEKTIQNLSSDETKILEFLIEPKTIEELSLLTNLEIGVLKSILTEMELKNLVLKRLDGLFQKIND